MRHAAALLIALVAFAAGCRTADNPDAPDTAPPDPAATPFERDSTLACLRGLGASVAPLLPSDRELRALRDLAQRTSFQIRIDDQLIALALARNVAGAELLEEVLAFPGAQYRLARRGNVVLLYRPATRTAYRAVLACL